MNEPHLVPTIRNSEAVAIPHSYHLPITSAKRLNSTAEVATIRHLERRGKSRRVVELSSADEHPELARNYSLSLSVFGRLIDPAYGDILCAVCSDFLLCPTARRTFSHTPGTKERCEIELREETARHILRVLLCEVREIERRFVKPHGLGKSSWQDADRRVLWRGCPDWGRERHSEHSGRVLTGVGTACQRPEAKRSRKAFRALCGTELDGP